MYFVSVVLNYGVFRRKSFNSTPVFYMFFDMGASSTTATIVGELQFVCYAGSHSSLGWADRRSACLGALGWADRRSACLGALGWADRRSACLGALGWADCRSTCLGTLAKPILHLRSVEASMLCLDVWLNGRSLWCFTVVKGNSFDSVTLIMAHVMYMFVI